MKLTANVITAADKPWMVRPSVILNWIQLQDLVVNIPSQEEMPAVAITFIPAPSADINSTSTAVTEDDTFRILARPDIHKMVILHTEWSQKQRALKDPFDTRKNIEFVKHHGWGWIEFLNAKKEKGYSA
jgi:hypothetical protein